MTDPSQNPVAVIGGGFAGLSAAYELAKAGHQVLVLESDAELGGLAGSFTVEGTRLEKFYHHWFTNDRNILDLAEELGTEDHVRLQSTNTGMYYANHFFKLSTPMDLLKFTPLPFWDRVRLGLLALRARRVQDWKELENLTAEEWLKSLGGEKVYRVVWEPLLRGKFGAASKDVSAVWFWNKLKLRGGSRGKGGDEQLAYYEGGFDALVQQLRAFIEAQGGTVLTGAAAEGIDVVDGAVRGVLVNGEMHPVRSVIATHALPLVADLLAPHVSPEYQASLRRIRYIGNVCMVLEMDRSLSDTYWLNVNDPDFPFVGVIEHTNFESVQTYGGRHIVYLSKYLPTSDELYAKDDKAFFEFTVPYLKRMFPEFKEDWVQRYSLWKAQYSQPIVERHYSSLIPGRETPIQGFYLASMAQIYPEDRGTNYAIREGRDMGRWLAERLP